MKRTGISLVLLTLAAGTSAAQEAPLSEVTVDMLVERLTPSGVRLRGVRGLSVEPREPARIDLAVGFEFDSAELTDQARNLLATVAEAFATDALLNRRFRLAGHTDARGGDDYNQKLSEARAEAVRTHLHLAHGVETWRLEAEGYGKAQLLFPDAPEDGRNRRVEITTLE